ncbi:MAG: pilus assembly protein PilX, partial [Lachnospiraceae bacterium]|nr:pilus assembly protein PilX [Lachnospiraceae bacterium]
AYRLRYYDAVRMATQLGLVASLLLHLISNITPLRIALGIQERKNLQIDVLLVLAILLLVAGLAFVVYYIRWQVIL